VSAGKFFIVPLLLVALLTTALAVIYSKYQSRQLFVEIQNLERELDFYTVEWGQLQLEQTTLAEPNRIERLARSKLGLVMPVRKQIVYIKP
jgi:cell division protein FtsL